MGESKKKRQKEELHSDEEGTHSPLSPDSPKTKID